MAAAILSFNSTSKPQMQNLTCFSALPNQDDDSTPLTHRPPPPLIIKPNNNNNKRNYRKLIKQQQQQQQPSVLEIERAIGAGFFRDRDDTDSSKEKGSLFENIVGEKEGSVEKKLRETGEWLLHHSQNTSPSAGKQILMTMFVWVIPLWIFGFLIAAGVLQLPFTTPFLQDILS